MTDSVPILMYHAVAENPTAATLRLSVTPRSFDEQVGFLVGRGFTGMTFSDLAEAFETGQALPQRPVVLTFDDGYADFAQTASPILRRYDFPATVFVTSGWIADAGSNAAGAPLGRMLSWAQVRELAAAGIEIGAHSHSHPELDQLADAVAARGTPRRPGTARGLHRCPGPIPRISLRLLDPAGTARRPRGWLSLRSGGAECPSDLIRRSLHAPAAHHPPQHRQHHVRLDHGRRRTSGSSGATAC